MPTSASPVRPTSQIVTDVLDRPVTTTLAPSGENDTSVTPVRVSCDERVIRSRPPPSTSPQTLAVPSELDETSRVESALQSTAETYEP